MLCYGYGSDFGSGSPLLLDLQCEIGDLYLLIQWSFYVAQDQLLFVAANVTQYRVHCVFALYNCVVEVIANPESNLLTMYDSAKFGERCSAEKEKTEDIFYMYSTVQYSTVSDSFLFTIRGVFYYFFG